MRSYVCSKETRSTVRAQNVETRLCWALEHINRSVEDGKHVIVWSDESSIEVPQGGMVFVGMEIMEASINSMQRHCQAMIDAKGGWTRY